MAKRSYSRQSLLAVFLSFVLLFSVTNLAFADVINDRKKYEEKKAVEYQKKILNFDYEKNKKQDKGFKSIEIKDIKKKEIIRPHPANFKIIKAK